LLSGAPLALFHLPVISRSLDKILASGFIAIAITIANVIESCFLSTSSVLSAVIIEGTTDGAENTSSAVFVLFAFNKKKYRRHLAGKTISDETTNTNSLL
ncbi:MAG: hypothetical protein ACLFQ6_13145, partial [Candidatus Sumerlaeia bacterium]